LLHPPPSCFKQAHPMRAPSFCPPGHSFPRTSPP
jgi:hypothetical protein